jgi:hypothetical protein
MEKCNCWREFDKNRAYCAGTKNLEYCTCNGDQVKCDFYEDLRAKASGTYDAHLSMAISKLQRLGVIDEEGNIAEEFRNVLMKK